MPRPGYEVLDHAVETVLLSDRPHVRRKFLDRLRRLGGVELATISPPSVELDLLGRAGAALGGHPNAAEAVTMPSKGFLHIDFSEM